MAKDSVPAQRQATQPACHAPGPALLLAAAALGAAGGGFLTAASTMLYAIYQPGDPDWMAGWRLGKYVGAVVGAMAGVVWWAVMRRRWRGGTARYVQRLGRRAGDMVGAVAGASVHLVLMVAVGRVWVRFLLLGAACGILAGGILGWILGWFLALDLPETAPDIPNRETHNA